MTEIKTAMSLNGLILPKNNKIQFQFGCRILLTSNLINVRENVHCGIDFKKVSKKRKNISFSRTTLSNLCTTREISAALKHICTT